MVRSASRGFFHHFKWSKRPTGSRTPRIGGSSLLAKQLSTSSLATIPTMDTAALTPSADSYFVNRLIQTTTIRVGATDAHAFLDAEALSRPHRGYPAQRAPELETSPSGCRRYPL